MGMKMRHALGAILLVFVGSTQAATIVGVDTLINTDDLTIIEFGNGQQYDFLDISATAGMSWSNAQVAFQSDGFRVADNTEVAELFSAFGFSYVFNPLALINNIPDASNPEELLFISYFGDTASTGTLARFLNPTGPNASSYFCIGSVCRNSSQSFVSPNHNGNGISNIGTVLIRVTGVPVPAAVWLFGSGLGLLGWMKRRH
jgi:hypothetical protein